MFYHKKLPLIARARSHPMHGLTYAVILKRLGSEVTECRVGLHWQADSLRGN